ncbi:Mov34/MPN/PAD-1 family protein [Mariprofundus micogutta]|uniref:Mov34/MPN/PAD-1 family protein n=1 Tax=Mariprofundus micogutta TaxID=1921010 RepID=A0A1L8CLC0_9PROT|nr:M67 family metallopeptidase [Mariprofundus micogutta]GAV19706.1 Mov34/MPN/PAD-1 family protein [Mariprofundus micogutta]
MTTPAYEPERFTSPEYLAVIDEETSPSQFNIPASCLKAIQLQGEAGFPHEICGLLVGNISDNSWNICEVHQVANLNDERAADRFMLDPAGYQAVDKALRGSGMEIVGVYHSHPNCPAKPSPTDLESAWDGFAYPIVSICDGTAADFKCWSLNSAATAFQNIAVVEL